MEILIIIGFIALGIFIYKKYQEYVDNKTKDYQSSNNKHYYDRKYNNVCWNCGEKIDSHINKKCTKCGRYYICNKCGKCLCDAPFWDEKYK